MKLKEFNSVLETNKRSSKYQVRLEFQGNLSSTGPSQELMKKKVRGYFIKLLKNNCQSILLIFPGKYSRVNYFYLT